MLARAAAAAARERGAAVAATAAPAPPLFFARWFASSPGDGKDAAADKPSPSSSPAPNSPQKKGPRGRRPSRRVAGSWAVSKELEDELAAARRVPAGAHLYDMRNSFPYFYEPRGVEEVAAALKAAAAEAGPPPPPPPPPRPGARPIVCWETRAVLHAGPAGASHPANRKVVATVALADLAAEAGLSADAARHVALVAGPRYHPGTGKLRLTADTAPNREGNVAIVERLLRDLVAEGRRVWP